MYVSPYVCVKRLSGFRINSLEKGLPPRPHSHTPYLQQNLLANEENLKKISVKEDYLKTKVFYEIFL